jgi:hypothetical protein
MDINGQLCDSAALFSEKEPRVPFEYEPRWIPEPVSSFREEKYLSSLPGNQITFFSVFLARSRCYTNWAIQTICLRLDLIILFPLCSELILPGLSWPSHRPLHTFSCRIDFHTFTRPLSFRSIFHHFVAPSYNIPLPLHSLLLIFVSSPSECPLVLLCVTFFKSFFFLSNF